MFKLYWLVLNSPQQQRRQQQQQQHFHHRHHHSSILVSPSWDQRHLRKTCWWMDNWCWLLTQKSGWLHHLRKKGQYHLCRNSYFVHNKQWIKCGCYVSVYDFFNSKSSKLIIPDTNILPHWLRGSIIMFHYQNLLNQTTLSPKFSNLFKSIEIPNLKRFEIFDRGRECDLNMKIW